MWSTPAVLKQYNKMAVLHFFLVNSSLYILFSMVLVQDLTSLKHLNIINFIQDSLTYNLEYRVQRIEEEKKVKGSDCHCMVAELRLQYYWDIFRIHLRPIRRYSAYLFSKSANSIFKILINCLVWRDNFENWF